MATAITYPPQATEPSDIVAAVKTRLSSGLGLNSHLVRLIVDPNPLDVPFTAEKHVEFTVSSPIPVPSSGAGRLAYRVYRNIIVFPFTQNLLDEAGSDESAIEEHLNFEDDIIDVMVDQRPASLQQGGNDKVGTRGFLYVPGDTAPQRWKGSDQGLLYSTLTFQIEYLLHTRVTRQIS